MDATHLHLLINHVPVIASFIGALILLYGIITKSYHTKNAAYLILLLAAVGGGIAFLTGEEAEHVAEKLPGVTEEWIHDHEEAAEKAIIGIMVLGLASLVGLLMNRRPSGGRITSWIVLVIALATFGITAYAAYLGGSIRHTEIRPSANAVETVVKPDDD